jgi:hypothetical protein
MSPKVQVLERQVKQLDRPSLAVFRDWFRKYDSEAWDRQITKDARAGKLSKLARLVLSEHKAGKTRAL